MIRYGECDARPPSFSPVPNMIGRLLTRHITECAGSADVIGRSLHRWWQHGRSISTRQPATAGERANLRE
eukprot:3377409-Pyramimonas_sp.AAC.1